MPHEPGHYEPIFDWSTSWGEGGVPGAIEGMAEAVDWEAMRDPAKDWQQFMLGITPGVQRAPIQNMRDRLMTRYALAQPYMYGQGGTPSFAGYLAGGPGQQADLATLRERARYAGEVGGLGLGEFGERFEALGPETEGARRLALMASTFNPLMGGNVSNQVAAANLLAQQRAGGGTFQGQMGEALRRAMSALYATRETKGYDPNTFLNWYMNTTSPA